MDFEENNNEKISTKELKKKEKLISFSRINKYYFLPFLYAVSLSISSNILDDKIGERKFIKKIIESIQFIVAGFIFFIPSLSEKTQKKRNDSLVSNLQEKCRHNSIKLLYNDNSIPDKIESKNINIYFCLILIPLLFSLGSILMAYFCQYDDYHHYLF